MVMKRAMIEFLTRLVLALRTRLKSRTRLEAENLALRQVIVLSRKSRRIRPRNRRISRPSCGVRRGALAYGADDIRLALQRDQNTPIIEQRTDSPPRSNVRRRQGAAVAGRSGSRICSGLSF